MCAWACSNNVIGGGGGTPAVINKCGPGPLPVLRMSGAGSCMAELNMPCAAQQQRTFRAGQRLVRPSAPAALPACAR